MGAYIAHLTLHDILDVSNFSSRIDHEGLKKITLRIGKNRLAISSKKEMRLRVLTLYNSAQIIL